MVENTIVWTELALEDLKTIHSYISKDSKYYADRLIDKIISRVGQLVEYPLSGRIVPEFNIENMRELISGNYRIIYETQVDIISIARIHHSAKGLTQL